MGSTTKLKYAFKEYSRADLRELAPEALGGILRERVHPPRTFDPDGTPTSPNLSKRRKWTPSES